MAEENTWNPLVVALVATIATGFQILGGLVGCNFMEVVADENEVLAISETSAQDLATRTRIGLLCDGDFYDLDGDDMRTLSRYFYFGATGLGGLCMLVTWAISTCFKPSMFAWKAIPVLSSATALVNLPTFLVLETYPCDDFEEQSCKLSLDSYFLIAAIGWYVLVTALTQFLDPPEWVSQLHHWRVPKMRTMDTNYTSEDDDGSQDPILTPRLAPPKSSIFQKIRGNKRKTKSHRDSERLTVSYAPPLADLERGDSFVEEEVVSSQESDRPPVKKWTEFDSKSSPFREEKTTGVTSDQPTSKQDYPEPRALYQSQPLHSQAAPQPTTTSVPLSPPSLAPRLPSLKSDPSRDPIEQHLSPKLMYQGSELSPISPLTHQTNDSPPGSPSIERTIVHDPVLRHVSRVSTPSRHSTSSREGGPDETELTTPVRRFNWSQHESVLDGITNGDESLLDSSFDSYGRNDIPFIPNYEQTKRLATQGYSIYADLMKEDLARDAPGDDELMNRNEVDTSTDDSLLGAEDVQAIALEGTPIYASLLLDQEKDAPGDKQSDTSQISNRIFETTIPTKKSLSQTGIEGKSQDKNKVKLADSRLTEGKASWKLGTALRRANTGYDKLDDSAFDSDDEIVDDPPMTEVSFDPSDIQEVSLDSDVHTAQTKPEQALLDDWNKMFDEKGPIPVKMREAQEEDEGDREDEEELLRLISSEDFSDETPTEKVEEEEEQQSTDASPSPDKPPRSSSGTTLRPKRRARRSRSRASGSVGSSPSLLDVTIEEETQSDLEEFNKEEKKTLSGYAPESNKQRSVSNSLNMSGMHAYLAVEEFRSNEQKEVTTAVREALKKTRSRPDLRSNVDRAKTVRSLSPNVPRKSTWRSERENRVGIHDVAVVSDEDDSKKNDDTGKSANDLRQSRIQRLQQKNVPDLRAMAKLRREKIKLPPSYTKSDTSEELTRLESKLAQTPTQSEDSKVKASAVVSPSDDGSATTTPEDFDGDAGSALLSALDLELNDLDVSLAALSRPDGSEYGPDEHSI